jgi:hypothetical protein
VNYPYAPEHPISSVIYGAADINFKPGTCEVEGFNKNLIQHGYAEGLRRGMQLIAVFESHGGSGKRTAHWLKSTDDARIRLDSLRMNKAEMQLIFKTASYTHPDKLSESVYFAQQ